MQSTLHVQMQMHPEVIAPFLYLSLYRFAVTLNK